MQVHKLIIKSIKFKALVASVVVHRMLVFAPYIKLDNSGVSTFPWQVNWFRGEMPQCIFIQTLLFNILFEIKY